MTRLILLLAIFLLVTAHFAIPQNLEWVSNYDQAVLKAKETGKPIFIDCFADWCGWCHRLDEDVFTDPAFVQFMKDFVPLRIDVEDQAEGTHLAEKFRIDGLPALLIVDQDGGLLNRIGSFMPPKELIDEIQSMQKLLQKEKLSATDWQTEQMLGEEYLFRDMNEQAEVRFARILGFAGVPDRDKESTYFSLALAQYYQGKLEQALRTLNRYQQTYADGKSIEDVLLLLSQIYIEMEQTDKARTILQQFILKFPDSHNLQRAKDVLAVLKS